MMERRTALRLITVGVLAERLEIVQPQLIALAQVPATYKLQFFSPEQNELLDRLTEIIIPSCAASAGNGRTAFRR